MTINFEADQQDAMKRTEGIQSLADQVERLEGLPVSYTHLRAHETRGYATTT